MIRQRILLPEDCSGKGPCHHYGNLRSTDVGKAIPALYEGQGEPPDSVFAPGWTGLTENTFYLGIGLGFFLEPLRRLLGSLALRRRPPIGRHVRGAG